MQTDDDSDAAFLDGVLNRLAKITELLIEAAEVKDDAGAAASIRLERTRRLVERLYDISNNLHEEFTKRSKPCIKLVDINKLVAPKRTSLLLRTLMADGTPKGKKNVQFDKNVVVIISSSDEQSEEGNGCADGATPRKTRRRRRTVARPQKQSSTDSSLSTSLSSSDDEKDKSHKRTKKRPEIDKDDPKFHTNCYVKLERMSTEDMEEYYKNSQDLKEFESLSNLESLKRVRKSLNGSESSTDSDKKLHVTKKKKHNPSSGSPSSLSSSDTDVEDEQPLIKLQNPKDPDEPPTNTEQLVQEALNTLNESDDENKSSNSEEKCEKEAEKINESNTEDLAIEKPEDETEKPPENSPGTSGTEEIEQEKSETINKTNGENEWRNDELLKAKVTSSSDTDEDFSKFSKKMDRQERLSGDEDVVVPKIKLKRKTQKRTKKAIFDSDSDETKDPTVDAPKSSSSSSVSSSDNESDSNSKSKKNGPRKRVKRMADSSEEEHNESLAKDGQVSRKNIRKVWSKHSLTEETKKAEEEEIERKNRIAEKQKKYNQIFNMNTENNLTVDKLVLDFDEETNKELLAVDEKLVKQLKPHQVGGVKFMWDTCYESLKRASTTKGCGCILAHCMGLGKTLQVITLVHTLLKHKEETKVEKVMVVCPLNTVLNWVQEFKRWVPSEDEDDIPIYELVSYKSNHERKFQLEQWFDYGGVLIIGYQMYRNLSNEKNRKHFRESRKVFQRTLVDPGPDLVVCDEGHLLKNEKSNLSQAMNRLKTMRRIILTGTPLQNNLKEYFCMVQFIKPSLLGNYKEYLNRFVNPITNGQYTDSTPMDIQIMRRRSHVLHKMLDGVVQRRDYAVLQPYLPPKYEYVLFIELTQVQTDLYSYYLKNLARKRALTKSSSLFVDFQTLQQICTHPRVLLDKSIEEKKNRDYLDDDEEDSEGSLRGFINDDDEEESGSTPGSSSSEEGGQQPVRRTRAMVAATGGTLETAQEDVGGPKEWWQEVCSLEQLDDLTLSGKITLLFEILKECEQIGDKVLIFSQSLYSLNVIEYFLAKVDEATQNGTDFCGHTGSWTPAVDYYRLDGGTACSTRSNTCKIFNDPDNVRARLFLISTRAGGLGINLVAANRVIIFDVSWNPSHDVQSIYRVYRFGQTKPSYVYRFVSQGTMEMKVYERQVTKQAISKRVIDEQQIDRHYNQSDMVELYHFDPSPPNRPTPLVPKDILFAEMLQRHEKLIYRYHEHQSLLENKEEESLNEEERKAAWEEFENEKKAKVTPAFNQFSVPVAEFAFKSMIRRLNPHFMEKQVDAMAQTLVKEMTEQIAAGNMTLMMQVQKELQTLRQQQEQILKMQALSYIQSQGQFKSYGTANGAGPSRPAPFLSNPNEIIDLND